MPPNGKQTTPIGDRLTYNQSPTSQGRGNFGELEAARINNSLRQTETGRIEFWTELITYILRTDPHVRSVYQTRLLAVAGAPYNVVAASDSPQDLAAAEFAQAALKATPALEDRFSNLLHGMGVGVACIEHLWAWEKNKIITTPKFIPTRYIEFRDDWSLKIKSYENGSSYQWVNVTDHPNKFVVHTPQQISEVPTLAGDLQSITWAWFFKRWAEKYQLNGMERLANGLILGMIPDDAPAPVMQAMREGLESIAADGVGVFRIPSGASFTDPVKVVQFSGNPGEAFGQNVEYWNNEISKALLGSGLNVDVGDSGGNRALGESQFDTTILPRLKSDAARLATTLRRDWLRPLVKFNRHILGDAEVPYLEFEIVSDVQEAVDVTPGLAVVTSYGAGQISKPAAVKLLSMALAITNEEAETMLAETPVTPEPRGVAPEPVPLPSTTSPELRQPATGTMPMRTALRTNPLKLALKG